MMVVLAITIGGIPICTHMAMGWTNFQWKLAVYWP